MSTHHLPDDLSDWPNNPYQVLGVEIGADEQTLKRAYAKLIRHFKPEHHPEEFQRIREAYESAKQWSMPWEHLIDAVQSSSDSDTESFDELELGSDWDEDEPEPPRAALSEWEAAWDQARLGHFEASYLALQKVAQRHPGDEELCLRLFWILKLQPDLDPRKPVSWLAAGLRNTGLRGRLYQLYLYELEHDPQMALVEGTEDLLNLPDSADRLGQLLSKRVQATCQLGLLDQARAELDQMRKPLVSESPAAWVRVLSGIADEVAWQTWPGSREFYAQLSQELASFEDMHIELDDVFDRFELQRELRKSTLVMRKKFRESPLVDLAIRSLSDAQDGDYRAAFYRELTHWVSDPKQALEDLEAMYAEAPQVIGQIGESLRPFGFGASQYTTPDGGDEGIRELAKSWSSASYPSIRDEIIEFCIEEWVTPEDIVRNVVEMASQLDQSEGTIFIELATHLHEDVPLRVLADGLRACDIACWS